MRWREAVTPVPMVRVALVAPREALRPTLVRVAEAGTVEIDRWIPAADLPLDDATRRLRRLAAATPPAPVLATGEPDLDALERAGRTDLLAGEAQLRGYAAQAVEHDEVVALLGWAPGSALADLSAHLGEVGAAAVPLPRPRGIEPPTAVAGDAAHRAFGPLVGTYTTVPYADIDPTVLAGLAYVLMFGAMFGDVGHGALLVLGGLLVRAGRPARLAGLRPHWLFIVAAGLASVLAGLAYGEFFGPTGVVPVGWLEPMQSPVPLLVAAIVAGAGLLGGAYALGTVNRVREGGWAVALYSPAGMAGSLLFLAAGAGVLAWYLGAGWLGVVAGAVAAAGLVLAFIGLLVAAGGGAAGALQATVELFDVVIRLGTNVVSFARLAAFGLTHAVLGWIVWRATVALWGAGAAAAVAAVAVFLLGNAVAFTLEALVAGVQALRLEYYELFSRVFVLEGRPFQPWRVPTERWSGPVPAATAAPTEQDRGVAIRE